MRSIKKGATSQSVYFEFLDSTSTTGGRKTGMAYNSSGLTAYYARNGAASAAITLATLASASAAWSSGGFVEVDATNMPGVYRLDVPNAAFASGAESVVITLKGVTGMAQASLEIQLVDNTPADVYTRVGAPVGASISADIAGVQADTDNIQTRIPVALVSGRMDSSVGAMATDVLTSTALASSAVTEIQAGLSTLDAAGVRGAVGLASANLDTQLSAIAGYIDTEVGAIKTKTDQLVFTGGRVDASVGAMQADTLTATALASSAVAEIQGGLSTLDAAGVRAAVGLASANLDTQLGAIAGYLDMEIGTLLTNVAAIKVKTDQLAFTVAGKIDANILYVNGIQVVGNGETGTEWGPG